MNWENQPEKSAERQTMTRLLLEAGAEPGDLSECRSTPDCRVRLLPLLERGAKKK